MIQSITPGSTVFWVVKKKPLAWNFCALATTMARMGERICWETAHGSCQEASS